MCLDKFKNIFSREELGIFLGGNDGFKRENTEENAATNKKNLQG